MAEPVRPDDFDEISQIWESMKRRPVSLPKASPEMLVGLEDLHKRLLRSELEQATKDRGMVTESLLAIPRGPIEYVGGMLPKITKTVSGTLTPGTEMGAMGKAAEKIQTTYEDWRERTPWMQVAPQHEESYAKRSIAHGIESATQSMSAGLTGALAGGRVGGLYGAILGYAGGAAAQFGLAQYDDMISQADALNIRREKSQPAAIRSAIYETGFEFVSDLLDAWFLGLTKPLTRPALAAIKDGIGTLLKTNFKEFLARTAGVVASEVSTEMLTAGLQAEEARRIGLGDQRFWDAAKEAFGAATVAALIFGGAGGAYTHLQRRDTRKALEDPQVAQKDRFDAAKMVEDTLKEIDPKIAQIWAGSAHTAITQGKAIPLDQDLTTLQAPAPTAPPVTKKQPPAGPPPGAPAGPTTPPTAPAGPAPPAAGGATVPPGPISEGKPPVDKALEDATKQLVEDQKKSDLDQELGIPLEEELETVPPEAKIEEVLAAGEPEEPVAEGPEDMAMVLDEEISRLETKIANIVQTPEAMRTERQRDVLVQAERKLEAFRTRRAEYDREKEGGIPGAVGEGEKFGWPVQEPGAGPEEVAAGGVFQGKEGEEEVKRFEPAEKWWGKTIKALSDEWGDAHADYEDARKAIQPRLEAIDARLKELKAFRTQEANQEKKALREERTGLVDATEILLAQAEESFVAESQRLQEQAVEKALALGMPEDRVDEFAVEFSEQISPNPPYIEVNHGKTHQQVFDEIIRDYLPGAEGRPAEEEVAAQPEAEVAEKPLAEATAEDLMAEWDKQAEAQAAVQSVEEPVAAVEAEEPVAVAEEEPVAAVAEEAEKAEEIQEPETDFRDVYEAAPSILKVFSNSPLLPENATTDMRLEQIVSTKSSKVLAQLVAEGYGEETDQGIKATEKAVRMLRKVKAFEDIVFSKFVTPVQAVKAKQTTVPRIIDDLLESSRPALLASYKDGFITQGHFASKATEAEAKQMQMALKNQFPDNWQELKGPDLSAVIPEETPIPIKSEPKAVSRHGTKGLVAYYLEGEDGSSHFVNASYFDFLRKRHPDASWFAPKKMNQPLVAKEGDEIVAVLMRLRDDYTDDMKQIVDLGIQAKGQAKKAPKATVPAKAPPPVAVAKKPVASPEAPAKPAAAADVKTSFEYLREKGVLRDTSFVEGYKSGILEPDRKTREHIENVVDAVEVGEIAVQDIPEDLIDWFYNYTKAKEIGASKTKLDAKFLAQQPKPVAVAEAKPEERQALFKKGERVVLKDGRHGEVVTAERMVTTMRPIFGGGGEIQRNIDIFYDVKTDQGARRRIYNEEELTAEAEGTRPAEVVPDIEYKGETIEPEHFLDRIQRETKTLKDFRGKYARAKKPAIRANWLRDIETLEKGIQERKKIFNAWEARYPQAALTAKQRGKAEAPAAPVSPEGARPTAAEGAPGTLEAYGLELEKGVTKKGNTVWEVSGNTKEHSGALKAAGGRWYGPKKVWSFYTEDDPTEAILEQLSVLEKPVAAEPAPAPTLQEKAGEVKDHLANVADAFAQINKLLGEKGQVGPGEEVDETLWNQIKPLLKYAWDELVAAGKSAKDFVALAREQLGVKGRPYFEKFVREELAKKPGEEQKPPAPQKLAEYLKMLAELRPNHELASWVGEKLAEEEAFTSVELFRAGKDFFEGTIAEGAFTARDAYDAMEIGLNLFLKKHPAEANPQADLTDAEGTIEYLKKLANLLPTQSYRDLDQEELQQFSTPPHLAYLAAWAANLDQNDVVIEPSAGTGSLAVMARMGGVKSVIVNELDPRRSDLLRLLEFDRQFQENAEQLDRILPEDIKPTVVLMNPPFSSTAGRIPGKRDTKNATQHIEQALDRLEPGGRLVVLVGRGMSMDAATFKSWWVDIQKKYDVKADLGLSGQEYKKFGTSFDNRLLIIDKSPPRGENIIRGDDLDTLGALRTLEAVRNDRRKPSLVEPGRPETPEKVEGEKPGPEEVVLPATHGVGVRKPGSERPERGGPGTGEGPVGVVGPEVSVQGRPGETPGEPGIPAPGKGPVSKRPSIRTPAQPTGRPGRGEAELPAAEPVSPVEALQQVSQESEEAFSDSIYETYRPQKVTILGAQKHPGKLVESAAMHTVDPPTPTYVPKLPKEVVEKGLLSEAQLEPVIRAGENHQKFLPNGRRMGMFDGDGTGVGKGRIIAGVILDNWNQGRKKAVWLSVNQKLFEDAQRDLSALNFEKVPGEKPERLFNLSSVKPADRIKRNQGVMFVTYGTLIGGTRPSRTEGTPDLHPQHGQGAGRLEQIIQWLGEDFDGVIAFDEAHKMGNALTRRGARGIQGVSQTARLGIQLQDRLPNARVVYVSATGATEVMNLAYADRLGLWGEGTAFADREDFVNQIGSGGIAAMEFVAQDMKAMGKYVARGLSYEDVEYQQLAHVLSAEQRRVYDVLAESWQLVLDNIHAALQATNASQRQANWSAFWSNQQRFFNAIISSMQLPSVLSHAKEELQKGNSPVFQIVNTNEARQDRALAELEDEDDLEAIDLTPREMLLGYLERSFPTQQFEDVMDPETGEIVKRPVVDSQGNPVDNPEALRMKQELIQRIGALPMPEAPIDLIIREIGHKNIAEITGRKRRIVEEANKKEVQQRTKASRKAELQDFIEDRRPALIFSEAGGTGASYHTDAEYPNQRKRIHYVIQAGWSAVKCIQGFGRTHRSNQVSAPIYVLPSTDIIAQKRFISSIARRLDQLGALTKGQRETGGGGLFSARDNLESAYALDAWRRLGTDIVAGNVEGWTQDKFTTLTGMRLTDRDGNLLLNFPPITQFLNRMLSLKIADQETLFTAFSDRLDTILAREIANGTLDVGLETLRAKKIDVAKEQTVYTDSATGAETKYISLNVTEETKRQTFEQAVLSGRAIEGFVQNVRSQRIWAVGQSRQRTTERGGIVGEARLTSPGLNAQWVETRILLDKEKFQRLEDYEAEKMWNKEYEETPTERTIQKHMISGIMLPIWDRISGHPRIFRVRTSTGRRLLGRMIEDKNLQDTLKSLGAEAEQIKVEPEEGFHFVFDQGSMLVLANDWKIKRSRVAGEHRIELIGPTDAFLDQLRNMGVKVEQIQWRTRFFIPTERETAIALIRRITANRPVIQVVQGKAAILEKVPEEISSKFQMSEEEAKGTPVADVKAHVAPIIAGWKGAPAIEVVESVYDLPKEMIGDFKEQFREKSGRVSGAYNPRTNKVYLIADGLNSAYHAESVLLHETVAHFGLRKLLGKELDPFLEQVWFMYGKKGLQGIADKYQLDLSKRADQLEAAEEMLAKMAQTNEKPTFMARLIAKVREILRRLGFKLTVSEGDIRAILAVSRRALETGRQPTQQEFEESILAGRPMFALTGPVRDVLPEEAIEEIEAAQGLQRPGIRARAEKFVEGAKAAFTRHFPLLDPARFGKVMDILRRFEAVPKYSRDKALDHLKDILKGFSQDDYSLFTMRILLGDMVRDLESGLLEPEGQDEKLPLGFHGVEQVQKALEDVTALAEGNEKVRVALEKRNKIMNQLRKDLVAKKILPKQVLDTEEYYHHQVIEYLELKHYGTKTSSQDVRTHKKGWQIARTGYMGPYNTEYMEAEFEVLAQGISQLKTVETLEEIEAAENKAKTFKGEAKRANMRRLMQKIDDAGDQGALDTLQGFRTKIAIGMKNLSKLIEQGGLYVPSDYQHIIEEWAESIEQRAADKADWPDDPGAWTLPGSQDPRFFEMLAWIVNSGGPGSRAAATIFKAITSRNKWIKAYLGKDFRTWKQVMRETQPGYVAWKPKPFSAWHLVNSIPERILEQVLAQERNLVQEDIRKVLARGMDVEWAIPKELAETLDNFRDFRDEGFVAKLSERTLNWWKQYILLMPLRMLKYNINNWSGDLDIVLAYNPKILKYAYKAAVDLWAQMHDKAMSPELKADLDESREADIIGGGMTIHDIPDVTKNLTESALLKGLRGEKPGFHARYWSNVKNYTVWRENILRLAAYRFFKDELQKGKRVYGASNPAQVDQITERNAKAALLARELIGDYGNLTQAGQYIRRKMVPFFSWLEINAPRYVRMFRNLRTEGEPRNRAVGMASLAFAKKGAGLAFKASMLYALINMWNWIFFPEEEDELGEAGRRQLHIILPPGRREDGTIMSMRFQGALSDALSWFGAEDAPDDISELARGKISFYKWLKESGLGGVNKMWQGVRPDVKATFELATGKTTYPDVSRPLPIRDKFEYVSRMFAVEPFYRRLAGKPLRGGTPEGRLLLDLSNLLTYTTDPGELAYHRVRRLANNFLEEHNLEKSVVEPTNKSNALYYYKQSLRFGDPKAAMKYLKQYQDLGGTLTGLKISLKLAHPMAGVPVRFRHAFVATLDQGERTEIKKAINWYEQTYLGRQALQ